jgi:perosamine synthetase
MTKPLDKAPVPIVKVAMPPREQLMPLLEEVLYGGMIGEGDHVYDFEARFASHFGLSNTLAVSSGTAALHISLLLAGAKAGVEVITTSMTAEPTNTTILNCGATPVFADVDPTIGNLSPAAVEAAITPQTVAIIVVHYAGYPADLAALRSIADRHGISLIEDCAHALGACYEGKPIGSFGDTAIFSFQAIKHMTTVDGGMLVLRDQSQMDDARRLRWFGLVKGVPRTDLDITTVGFKYNMHNVAAVIGNAQLDHIAPLLLRHIENAQYFDREFAGIKGLSSGRVLPGSEPSYWLYTLLADDPGEVEARLADIGVMASKLHRPNHLHTVFRPYARHMPGLDEFYRRLVHIPCGWWVDDDTRGSIVTALAKG